MKPGNNTPNGEPIDTGFWRLQHEHLAAVLARNDLSWESARVYLALADMTLGYGKTRDVVSLGQIADRAGMIRCHVVRALKRLADLGLYGQSRARGQQMARWVIWPPPAVTEAGTSTEAGNRSVAEAGNRTVTEGVTGAGTHQDTKKGKKLKKGEKSAAKPPAASGKNFSLTPGDHKGNGDVGRLVGLWVEGFQSRIVKPFAKSARGRLAGTIKNLLGEFATDDLAAAIGRWFSESRQSYSIGLFKVKLEDGDADLTGRVVEEKYKGHVNKASAKAARDGALLEEL